jgi:serine/threonine protein kinase
MELTVQNVYGLLLRSKLLSVEEAKAMFARWQEESKDSATNLAKFAAWMVAHKYLTEYQASLLARGHAEGFFLNDYKILDRLGKGRMAGVYKAQYRLGQIVAIKVLPPSKAREATMLARFQREARLAIRLRHPNIVRTFQTGMAEGLHFLVMEYLEGETLEDVLLRRKQFPPPEAVRLIYQALQGLQHIHSQGLVHRDLKPANLMLVPPPGETTTTGCTVKILDIGLGRVFDDAGETTDSGLTSEGVLLGTPDYMAPEQARDPRNTDIRADIYSLGCVLYHLLAGQPPFPDTNIISQMIKHATEPARLLREFNKDIPDGLQQIINWMMAKEPAGRYPTPERAAQALEVYLAAGQSQSLPSSPDLDPQMQSYLAWVEAENSKNVPPSSAVIPTVAALPPPVPSAAGNKPPSATVSVAASAGVSPAGSGAGSKPRVARPEPADRSAARDKHEKHKGEQHQHRRAKKKKPIPPVPAEGPVQEETVSVELVEMPAERPARKEGETGLTRRDFIMFFAGVGTTLNALLIGWGLAALLRRRTSRTDEDTE